jgi:signal recognition particle subunit SRP54
MVGPNGSGKTTTAAKLALHLRAQGHRPLLVAADADRPAADTQLQTLARQINVPVFHESGLTMLEVCQKAVQERGEHDVLLLDTAGRQYGQTDRMGELRALGTALHPHEVILVVDAMIGQDAVPMARGFDESLRIDSLIVTKIDGGARAGAALSIATVLGRPIRFVGVGEKVGNLETFDAQRTVSHLLGQEDMRDLLEKTQKAMSRDEARSVVAKFRSQDFNLEDMRKHLRQLRALGSVDTVMAALPGVKAALQGRKLDAKSIDRLEAVIQSMTVSERLDPSVFNPSRKRRVARGAGVSIEEVNKLLQQYDVMRITVQSVTHRS